MFKVGDKVRCLEQDPSGLNGYSPGCIFRVVALDFDYIIFDDLDGDERLRQFSEFELVEENEDA